MDELLPGGRRMDIRVDSDTLVRAMNSQFTLLRVQSNEGQAQQVTCKSSFFTWAVHCLRYNFSKGYQSRVHTMRHEILRALPGSPNDPSSPGSPSDTTNDIVRNRRAFNQYTLKQLNASSQTAETSLQTEETSPQTARFPETTIDTSSPPEIFAGKTPDTSHQTADTSLQTAESPETTINTSSPPEISAGKTWPATDTVYDTFWHKKGEELTQSGYRNLFRFQKKGNTMGCPDIKLSSTGKKPGSEITFAELTLRTERRLQNLYSSSLGNVQKTTAGCVVSFLQLTTPVSGKQRCEGLYGWVDLLPDINGSNKNSVQKELGRVGMTGNPPERFTDAHLRVLGTRIGEPVKRLVEKHFRQGATKAEVIAGLDEDLANATNPEYVKQYHEGHRKVNAEEFEYLAQGVKDFATLYFSDSS